MAPRRKDPVQEAAKLISDMEITAPAVPVERIARRLKATVRYSPFEDEISGLIHIRENVPIIGVNSLHHPNRQRFTIAHEIGHLILDKDLISHEVHVDKGPLLFRRSGKSESTNEIDIIERDANRFAAELTMPKSFLDAALHHHKDVDDSGLVKILAQQFKVSEDAMKIRMNNLYSVWL